MKLNLLPPESKKRLIAHKINKIIASFLTLVFLVTLALSALLFINQKTLNISLEDLNKKIQDQKTKNNNYQTIESEMKEVFKISDSLKSLEQKRTLWSVILSDLIIDTPLTLKLTGFENKEGGKLIIKGEANNLRTIMLFKEKLEQSKYYKQAELESATAIEGSNSMSFILNVQVENSR